MNNVNVWQSMYVCASINTCISKDSDKNVSGVEVDSVLFQGNSSIQPFVGWLFGDKNRVHMEDCRPFCQNVGSHPYKYVLSPRYRLRRVASELFVWLHGLNVMAEI